MFASLLELRLVVVAQVRQLLRQRRRCRIGTTRDTRYLYTHLLLELLELLEVLLRLAQCLRPCLLLRAARVQELVLLQKQLLLLLLVLQQLLLLLLVVKLDLLELVTGTARHLHCLDQLGILLLLEGLHSLLMLLMQLIEFRKFKLEICIQAAATAAQPCKICGTSVGGLLLLKQLLHLQLFLLLLEKVCLLLLLLLCLLLLLRLLLCLRLLLLLLMKLFLLLLLQLLELLLELEMLCLLLRNPLLQALLRE